MLGASHRRSGIESLPAPDDPCAARWCFRGTCFRIASPRRAPLPVFGCAAHRSKGSAICGNALTVSEHKLSRAIFGSLNELVESHDFKQRFADQMARRIRSRKPPAENERAALENDVTSQEARVRRVTDAFATVGQSEALVAQLRREETRLQELRARLSSAQLPPQPAPVAADPAKLAKYLRHLEKLAEEAPERAREALGRVLGPVTLHPIETDGKRTYEARGAMNVDPAALSGDRVGASDKGSCGGGI